MKNRKKSNRFRMSGTFRGVDVRAQFSLKQLEQFCTKKLRKKIDVANNGKYTDEQLAVFCCNRYGVFSVYDGLMLLDFLEG